MVRQPKTQRAVASAIAVRRPTAIALRPLLPADLLQAPGDRKDRWRSRSRGDDARCDGHGRREIRLRTSAIAAGTPVLIDLARQAGLAAMAVRNSYNCSPSVITSAPCRRRLSASAFRMRLPPLRRPGRRGRSSHEPACLRRTFAKGTPAIVVDQKHECRHQDRDDPAPRSRRGNPGSLGAGREGQPTTDAAIGWKARCCRRRSQGRQYRPSRGSLLPP